MQQQGALAGPLRGRQPLAARPPDGGQTLPRRRGRIRTGRAAAVPALCLLWLAGCVAVQPVHPPVPPIRTEQVPVPPPSSTVVIWQPGHYDWNGADYVWVPGEWVDRAGHGTLWQDGYWQQSGSASVWVPGHWL